MNPLILTALMAFIGTALAFAAGVWGGLLGGVLLVGAAIFIVVAGLVVGSDAYDRGWQDRDEMEGDIYD